MQSSHSPCQVRSALDFVGDLIVNSWITKMRRELYVAENQDLFLSCSKAGKGLPLLPTVRDFGWQLLCALRLLRTAGLIHCDVKPENLLLAPDSCGLNS